MRTAQIGPDLRLDHRRRYSLLGKDTSDQGPVTDMTLPAFFGFYAF